MVQVHRLLGPVGLVRHSGDTTICRVAGKMEYGKEFYFRFSRENLASLITEFNSNGFVGCPPFHFISAHAFVEGAKSRELREVYETGRLICDSKPLSIYLSRFIKITPQVRGTDFMREFLLMAPMGSKHFFLGGTLETLKGIESYITKIRGGELNCEFGSPAFDVSWTEASEFWIKSIERARPNFVWVGMGAPRQFHVSNDIYKALDIPTFSVGAAFDFLAGSKRECPSAIANIGLEWLFRLLSEPRRLWKRYLTGNVEFLISI